MWTYGYWHMELTRTKQIRGLLTLRKLLKKIFFLKTTQAFDHSQFKPLGLPTSRNHNLDEKDLHLPKRDYSPPPKLTFLYMAKDDNGKRTLRRFLEGTMAKDHREQWMREFFPYNWIKAQLKKIPYLQGWLLSRPAYGDFKIITDQQLLFPILLLF